MSDHGSPAEEKRILAKVSDALTDQPEDEMLRPIWPAVMGRLEQERRPVLRPVFGAAAAAALLVGVALGLLVGSTSQHAVESEGSYLWSTVGSSLLEDGQDTISGIWNQRVSEEGRPGR